MSEHSRQNENENTDEGDDWSQDCLEYFFDNKIWLPDFVRSECPIFNDLFLILATGFYSDTTLNAYHRCPDRPCFRDPKYDSNITGRRSCWMCSVIELSFWTDVVW